MSKVGENVQNDTVVVTSTNFKQRKRKSIVDTTEGWVQNQKIAAKYNTSRLKEQNKNMIHQQREFQKYIDRNSGKKYNIFNEKRHENINN